MVSLLLAGLAGILASLSPCVLPILPIVLAAAGSEHRWGPLALTAGLALSFAAAGMVLGLAGFALGLDAEVLRIGAALLMLLAGATLLVSSLAARMSAAAEHALQPVTAFAARMSAQGAGGQFALGAVLGLAWAPCTGPALGAAIGLSAQAGTAPQAAAIMLVFAIGAAIPLLVLGYAARSAVPALRRRLGAAGGAARPLMGGALALFGLLVLTGLDKRIEAVATAALPEAWAGLIVRF
ncbi:cytochrome c biogenesis CcdA family protein [Falsiroseomonas selenitidurans]|uniref:Cytochrome c biogenesis protein CcdA n=1 Tax=Falsiroseomonas selenitidurans TaxID=2716335 RepID=A0ABX1DZC7_9PROT|nr:cytochrome c biogenesis protein CcdA [Falsiroseomonas selenitidurans]NKC29848.1 cytochrome c biogenesis protein CcdA [Falsiroseomonas selenitidurans]